MDGIASFWVSPNGEFWVRLKDGNTRPASDNDVRRILDVDPGSRAKGAPCAPAPKPNRRAGA